VRLPPLSLLRRILPALLEHKEVERGLYRLFAEYVPEKYRFPLPKRGLLRYLERNIFSILFLALYRAVGISRERRLLYGGLNHCLRGVVTGTDNLLDQEYKELLPLNFPEKARVFKSALHVLLFDLLKERLLQEAVRTGLLAPEEALEVSRALIRALLPIGEEEASEEAGLEGTLTPEEVLRRVHVHKGGNLLRLAFVAPHLLEKTRRERLEEAEKGVFSLGLALQVIDDLTDFFEDRKRRRPNYLYSWIYYRGSAEERSRLEALQGPITELFPEGVASVMRQAIGEALYGFRCISKAGLHFSSDEALKLIKFLFRIRGVGQLLAALPEKELLEERLPHEGP